MATNKGLGKGLGALLGDFDDPIQENSPYKLLPFKIRTFIVFSFRGIAQYM